MKRSVYLETTVISYLAARPARDPVTLGRQTLTREWWRVRREAFDLVIWDLVLQEMQADDSEVACSRLDMATGIPSLPVSSESVALAEMLVAEGSIPAAFVEDALHVALCAVNNSEAASYRPAADIDFLLTWNCTHLANAALRFDLESAVSRGGFQCPVICTPEELMEP